MVFSLIVLSWRDGTNKVSVRQKCLTGVLRSQITATSRRKKRPNQRPASAVGCQPCGQIGWALKVEQGIGQGLELLQRQRLDLGGGGLCEGAAAAV